ncbi:MAG: dihydroorotate dehydrogenase-like protein [Mariprofundaceae bacterium]
MDMATTYLGLTLANPLVPSASPLSRSLDSAKKLEDAGAAALVMYSLFEEQISTDEENFDHLLHHQDIGHAEAHSYLPVHETYKTLLEDYLEQLAALKAALDIPVIASLNGTSIGGWVEHGKHLQAAGADALELNVYYVAADIDQDGGQVEARYVSILKELKRHVSIPINMKLSPQFSSVGHFVKQLAAAGVDGVSLFNRFYQPDIDLDTLQVTPMLKLSSSAEALLAMRWIAILHGRVGVSLAATGGVHTAEDAIKMLLAGADVTHMCSALLQHGPERLTLVLDGIRRWMEENEYDSVEQLKGSVSQSHAENPAAFERANYMKVLESFEPPASVWR